MGHPERARPIPDGVFQGGDAPAIRPEETPRGRQLQEQEAAREQLLQREAERKAEADRARERRNEAARAKAEQVRTMTDMAELVQIIRETEAKLDSIVEAMDPEDMPHLTEELRQEKELLTPLLVAATERRYELIDQNGAEEMEVRDSEIESIRPREAVPPPDIDQNDVRTLTDDQILDPLNTYRP